MNYIYIYIYICIHNRLILFFAEYFLPVFILFIFIIFMKF